MSSIKPNNDARWHAEKAAHHMHARIVLLEEFDRLDPVEQLGREPQLGEHVEAHTRHATAYALTAMALKITEDDPLVPDPPEREPE